MPEMSDFKLRAEPGHGLYESFYFRGTSPDGLRAFWLKHNLLRYQGSTDVWLEGTLVLYDRAANHTHAVHASQAVDAERFEHAMSTTKGWNLVQLEFPNGNYVEIGPRHLRGRLVGEGGEARWDLTLKPSGMALNAFPYEVLYRLPWPRKKITTRDCHMGFSGEVNAGSMALTGSFHGMNGHNWGSEHAHTYAYANCAHFRGGRNAYFDGFSARVALVGGRLVTPLLTMASLHTGGRWHHFNGLLRAPRQRVTRLTDYAWQATLLNRSHRLELSIDGGTPAKLPWSALHYEHPDRKRSVVKNTKFARLVLRLFDRASGAVEDELASDSCELETLLPHNLPTGPGFVGQP